MDKVLLSYSVKAGVMVVGQVKVLSDHSAMLLH